MYQCTKMYVSFSSSEYEYLTTHMNSPCCHSCDVTVIKWSYIELIWLSAVDEVVQRHPLWDRWRHNGPLCLTNYTLYRYKEGSNWGALWYYMIPIWVALITQQRTLIQRSLFTFWRRSLGWQSLVICCGDHCSSGIWKPPVCRRQLLTRT